MSRIKITNYKTLLFNENKELIPLVKILKKNGIYGKFISYFLVNPWVSKSIGSIPIAFYSMKRADILKFANLDIKLRIAHIQGKVKELLRENGIA